MTVSSFFDQFPDFVHDPAAPILDEFERLRLHQRWKPGSKNYKKYRYQCLSHEFRSHHGHDHTKLDGWQELCVEVNITPAPASITQCKKVGVMCSNADWRVY